MKPCIARYPNAPMMVAPTATRVSATVRALPPFIHSVQKCLAAMFRTGVYSFVNSMIRAGVRTNVAKFRR